MINRMSTLTKASFGNVALQDFVKNISEIKCKFFSLLAILNSNLINDNIPTYC